jgi:hypothetical protein
VKLARFRKPKVACFLSYVGYRSNTSTSNIIYTYKYIQNLYPKQTGRGDKDRRKRRKEI